MPYHIKNKISKKSLKKGRMQPLPLMRSDAKTFRAGAGQRRVEENIVALKNLSASKNVVQGQGFER